MNSFSNMIAKNKNEMSKQWYLLDKSTLEMGKEGDCNHATLSNISGFKKWECTSVELMLFFNVKNEK